MSEIRIVATYNGDNGIDATLGGLTDEQVDRVVTLFGEIMQERFPRRRP